MTKKKQEDQKEQEIEKLSEWQKRNKEYLKKKAQEEGYCRRDGNHHSISFSNIQKRIH